MLSEKQIGYNDFIKEHSHYNYSYNSLLIIKINLKREINEIKELHINNDYEQGYLEAINNVGDLHI